MKTLATSVAVLLASALMPAAAAAADGGRIEFLRQADAGHVELRFDSSHDCAPSGDPACEWLPFATRVDPATQCSPPGADVVYTGTRQVAPPSQSAPAVVPLIVGSAGATATKYCLFVLGVDGVPVGVAEYTWSPPTPTPAPTPAPNAAPRGPTPARVFGTRDGKNAMRDALREEFGRSYRAPRLSECLRFEDAAMFCRARWSTPRFRFDGWVNVAPVGTDRVRYEGSVIRTHRRGASKRKRFRFSGRL